MNLREQAFHSEKIYNAVEQLKFVAKLHGYNVKQFVAFQVYTVIVNSGHEEYRLGISLKEKDKMSVRLGSLGKRQNPVYFRGEAAILRRIKKITEEM